MKLGLINETTQKSGYKARRFQVWTDEKGSVGIREEWLGPRGGVQAAWGITISAEDFNRIIEAVKNKYETRP